VAGSEVSGLIKST